MREPRTIEGAPAPLFDRLCAKEVDGLGSSAASRIMDRRLLRNSVLEEISRLLNTRSSALPATVEMANGTVLDYGIPDLTSDTPASEGDQQRLASAIERRIAAYEPRLRDVRVTVAQSPVNPRSLSILLSGSLRVGAFYEPVTFPLAIDRESARVGLGEVATAD